MGKLSSIQKILSEIVCLRIGNDTPGNNARGKTPRGVVKNCFQKRQETQKGGVRGSNERNFLQTTWGFIEK